MYFNRSFICIELNQWTDSPLKRQRQAHLASLWHTQARGGEEQAKQTRKQFKLVIESNIKAFQYNCA